ncbi:hypothetical protein E4M02_05440 [Brevundimonas sp. S30B]|uniref:DUF6491 family protein n=1 Tax=unclassified Brevundimonas TaxID=2622653 RepID=UPI001076331F|nr:MULTISPECIES: DUF6491 family protein [unclassified Brevundimonas]QBX36695.1 hypothetical protein E4M01_02375 [Brevundimonas sp. MF30-B]TFW04510.1 hypothetical protein E4M02_05440 [Brevundimonas sp. S30B]
MRSIPLLTVIATMAGLAGCAPLSPSLSSEDVIGEPRACFRTDFVRNFRSGDSQSIYIRDLSRNVFQLDTSGFCRDLDFVNAIVIRPQAGGGNRVCVDDWVVIGAGAEPCRAVVRRQLTEAEVEALPSRQRP